MHRMLFHEGTNQIVTGLRELRDIILMKVVHVEKLTLYSTLINVKF